MRAKGLAMPARRHRGIDAGGFRRNHLKLHGKIFCCTAQKDLQK